LSKIRKYKNVSLGDTVNYGQKIPEKLLIGSWQNEKNSKVTE
jgi:hypothetical protein